MADPRAFVSFDFDHDETEKILFVGQAKNSKTPFSIQDWSAKSSMPQAQWKAIVKEKINKCNMLKDAMTTAAAIDRVVHHSVILELNVKSYRAEAAKKRIRTNRAEKEES